MFENNKIFILGLARSGYQAAKYLISRGNTVILNDGKEEDKMDAEHVPAGYKFVKGFPVKNNGKRDMDAIKKDVDDIIWM